MGTVVGVCDPDRIDLREGDYSRGDVTPRIYVRGSEGELFADGSIIAMAKAVAWLRQ